MMLKNINSIFGEMFFLKKISTRSIGGSFQPSLFELWRTGPSAEKLQTGGSSRVPTPSLRGGGVSRDRDQRSNNFLLQACPTNRSLSLDTIFFTSLRKSLGMIRRVFFIIFLLTNASFPNNAQDNFKKANVLYRNKQFEQALEAYKKIEDPSAYVDYNIGNCAYQLEQYGSALLHWRRAEKRWGMFNRAELLENIDLLKEKLREKYGYFYGKKSKMPRFIINLKNFFNSFVRSIPLFYLQIIFLIFWTFLFFFLRSLYKKKRKYLILTLFFIVAFFGFILALRYGIDSRIYGVVVKEKASLLSGSGEKFNTLMEIPEAAEVVIKKESGDYCKVKVLQHGQMGWIERSEIELI